MLHALRILADWFRNYWKLIAGTVSLGTLTVILGLGQKLMGIAKSYYEVIKAKWEAHGAKAKAAQNERELLGLDKPSVRAPRNLSLQQRAVIVQIIKDRIRNDPPSPHYRLVWVRTFPIEDCQSFTYQLANAIEEAGIRAPAGYQGMGSADENRLYEKGIWICGTDTIFNPPTQTVLLEALTKANISAKLMPPSTPPVELIVGTAEP